MVYKKVHIPRSLKNVVWITYCGEVYNYKCSVTWCTTVMTPFNFEAGHNIPESRGGLTNLDNLRPICSTCNRSMGNRYTIDEYSLLYEPSPSRTHIAIDGKVSEDLPPIVPIAPIAPIAPTSASVPHVHIAPTVAQVVMKPISNKKSFFRSIMCMQ
jgi:HNH endonuclease